MVIPVKGIDLGKCCYTFLHSSIFTKFTLSVLNTLIVIPLVNNFVQNRHLQKTSLPLFQEKMLSSEVNLSQHEVKGLKTRTSFNLSVSDITMKLCSVPPHYLGYQIAHQTWNSSNNWNIPTIFHEKKETFGQIQSNYQ